MKKEPKPKRGCKHEKPLPKFEGRTARGKITHYKSQLCGEKVSIKDAYIMLEKLLERLSKGV